MGGATSAGLLIRPLNSGRLPTHFAIKTCEMDGARCFYLSPDLWAGAGNRTRCESGHSVPVHTEDCHTQPRWKFAGQFHGTPVPAIVVRGGYHQLWNAYDLCVAIAALGVSGSAAAIRPLRLKNRAGQGRGKLIHEGKVRAFLGYLMPPPVGDLRWKAPAAPARGWRARCDHLGHHSPCRASCSPTDVPETAGHTRIAIVLSYRRQPPQASSKLPVMFWIHGGGIRGSADGAAPPRRRWLPIRVVLRLEHLTTG